MKKFYNTFGIVLIILSFVGIYRWKKCLILLLASIGINGQTTKKRVCIVGAGLSGIVITKYISEYPDEFEPVVFEKSSNVGGFWIYTDSTSVDEHGLPVHSSMYKNLRTNGVKVEIIFPDYLNFGGETNNFTFAKHEEVLQYLRNYTEHFNLRQHIQFDTNVEKIKPLPQLKWLIYWQNLNDKKINKTTCDFVLVCTGHNFKGYIPKIWGIKNFKGQVLHSHVYRKPQPFANQTVILLGSFYSAVDIAIDISPFARKVYLSHRHDKLPGAFPSNLEQVPGVIGAKGGKLVLSNGTEISADTLMFATGYVYDYPFLDKNSGIYIEGGKRFHTIYKQMFNIERPTMAFMDIVARALPFRLVHAQANYIQKVLLGKLNLPSREQMMLEAQMQLAQEPADKGPVSNFDEFYKYYDELVHEAGGEPMPWWMRPYLNATLTLASRDSINCKDKRLVIHENNQTVEFV